MKHFLIASWLILFAFFANAVPTITTSSTFSPADVTRTYMDIGGVWNGLAEVTTLTGDTFTARFTNTAASPNIAYDFTPSILLPAGFHYVSGTGSVSLIGAGCPLGGVSGSFNQVGSTIEISLVPISFDLPVDCALDVQYGLYADSTLVSGTYGVRPGYDYANTDGGAFVGVTRAIQNILVSAGASRIDIDPVIQVKAVGATASWDIVVCNTGLGGLFDVVLDESLINPNPGNSLQITSMAQTAPATPVATGAMPVLTLPYLAPGECFEAAVQATVTGCDLISNKVTTTERTATQVHDTLGSIALNFNTPLLNYSAINIVAPNDGSVNHIVVPINNTGLGDAAGVEIQIEIPAPFIISGVDPDWTYTQVGNNAVFTYNNPRILNGTTENLEFDVAVPFTCPLTSINSTVSINRTNYTDACGNPYTVPIQLGSRGTSTPSAPFTFTKLPKAPPYVRKNLGQSGNWQLKLDPIVPPAIAPNVSQLQSDPVIVRDRLPSATYMSSFAVSAPVGTTYVCNNPDTDGNDALCSPGEEIQWSIPKALIGSSFSPLVFDINYTVSTNPCAGGSTINNNASYSYNFISPTCPVSGNDISTMYISTDPGAGAVQVYNVSPNPSETVYPGANGPLIEAGLPDVNLNGLQDRLNGEGNHLVFLNQLAVPGSNPAIWSTSQYRDNYGGLSTMTLVPGSLEVKLGAGAWVPVPLASITQSTPTLIVDLGFLAGASYYGNNNAASTDTSIRYQTSATDTDVNPSRIFTSTGTWHMASGSNGCALTGGFADYSQIAIIDMARRDLVLNASMGLLVDVCGPIDVTMSAVKNASDYVIPWAWNPHFTLTNGSYYYDPAQTPTYSGSYNAGNFTHQDNGGTNPEYYPNTLPFDQQANSSVVARLLLPALSPLTPAPISVGLRYDDTQTLSQAGLQFNAGTATITPFLVREGNLNIFVTPATYQVISNQVEFIVSAFNSNSGGVYNAVIEDIVPATMTPNLALTNAANPLYPATVSGQKLTWTVGTLAPGQSIQLRVFADVNGSSCDDTLSNQVNARWGCLGVDHQTKTLNQPKFTYPGGQLLLQHDSSSKAAMCDAGTDKYVQLIIKNTGAVYIYDLNLNEVLNPGTTGLDIAGPIEYSTDDGASWLAGTTATGSGTTGAPYNWQASATPGLLQTLKELAPVGRPGVNKVIIRFLVSGNELANASSQPITFSGDGKISCGAAVNSPGTPFNISILRPNMTVTKLGRNLTTGGAYSATVYGKNGDVIEWQVVVDNAGDYPAKTLDFLENLPDSGAPATATLAGPGHAATALTDSVSVSLPDIAGPASSTYLVTQTLTNACVNQNNVATIKWGCSAPATVTSPTRNTHSAALVMNGDFSSASAITQSWTTLPGGRGEITINMTNAGSYIDTISLEDVLLTGFEVDTSFTPTVTGDLTAVTLAGTATSPIFTFPAQSLDHLETATLKFRVVPRSNFDTLFDLFVNPETVANGFDPALVAAGINTVNFSYQNSCATPTTIIDTATLDPITPDLDIAVSPTTQLVASGSNYSYTYTITNNGDSGSIADNITFVPTIGAGWSSPIVTVTTPGVGGGGGVCAGTCISAQLGTLASGQSIVITVTGTASAAGPLNMQGDVKGETLDATGALSGNYYSQDKAKVKVLGYSQSKTLVSTSEAISSNPDLLIGEDAVWRLRVEFFGIDTDNVTSLTIRDTLPTGIGYISHVNTASHNAAYSISGNTVGSSGAINFAIPTITSPGAVFEVDLTARALNIAGNTNGVNRLNNLGTQFTFLGSTFGSNNAADGFGGTQATQHSQNQVTIKKPIQGLVKNVRNITRGGAFATSVAAQAGDTLEYRLQITNTGGAPGLDLTIADTLGAKLSLVDGAADGVDNDGDGSVDDATEGTYTAGSGGTLSFNEANTLLTSGSSFARLNNGNTITLLYRATVLNTVIPGDAPVNSATLNMTTLPGLTGSQSAPTGATGTNTGESLLTSTQVATANILSITFAKTLETTSVGSDTSLNILVGEQVRFKLEAILPQGTTPNLKFTDAIPAGYRLINTGTPIMGSAISGCSGTRTLPASLPSSGAVTLEMSFGTCVAAVDTNANRTITFYYDVQVENIALMQNATTIANAAKYSFTGFTSANSVITTTVKEPIISNVDKTVNISSGLDAGDIVTYTVTYSNTGTSTAYDLNITDTIASHTTYVAGSSLGSITTDPDISGSILTWGRNQASPLKIDLAAGASFSFNYKVKLSDTVEADEVLTNALRVEYTSLDGATGPTLPAQTGISAAPSVGTAGTTGGERNGSGGAINDYFGIDAVGITVRNSFSVAKTTSGDTLSPSGFRVGDLVTYTLAMTLQEGTVDGVKFEDVLPTGLAFDSLTSISPATSSTLTYTTPSNPLVGATGTIQWNFGTVVVKGDTNGVGTKTLTLTFQARIKNDVGITNATSQTINNTARVRYIDFANNNEVTTDSTASLALKQPSVAIAKNLAVGQATTVGAGDSVSYVVTLTNSGTAPAYNAMIRDTLPTGMRLTTPTITSATLNGVAASLTGTTYNSTTGLFQITLSDAQAINPGQTLVVNYQATVDLSVGGNVSLANSALLQEYFSKPSADATERRQYAASSPVSKTVTTLAPTDMGKSQDKALGNIGEVITYTLTVPSTAVNVNLYDTRITDSIPSNLTIISTTTNATTLGTTVTDTSSGQNINLKFDKIPANQKATVTIQARVNNSVSNQNATSISNQASYTWAPSAGGAASSAITSSAVSFVVKEPVLSTGKVEKSRTMLNPTLGLQAGDKIVYTITVTNTGTGPAHDLQIDDIADEDFTSPSVTANPDNPGAPSNMGTASGNTTWRWNVAGPLAIGATYAFDVEFTLGSAVQPYQTLLNTTAVKWTSQAGTAIGERTGADGVGGALNDYAKNQSAAVSVTTGGVEFAKIIKAPGTTNYTIGEEVTYQLVVDFITGTLGNLSIVDTLPAGLSFVSATAFNQSAAAVTIISSPAAGATGTLTFGFGSLTSSHISPKLTLEIKARVRNVVGNVDGTTLTNDADIKFDNPSGGAQVNINSPVDPVITLKEPKLVMALDAPTDTTLGAPSTYTATLKNTGTSKAYQPTVSIELPTGMRDHSPITLAGMTVTISGGRTVTLTAGTDYTVTYNATTGKLDFTFTSAQSYLDLTESLTIDFKAQVDNDSALGTDYTLKGTTTNYSSVTKSGGALPDTRNYPTVFGSGTVGTANGAVGDDPTDNAITNVLAPVLNITKSVVSRTALPGDVVSYEVIVSNTGDADATITSLSDTLPSFFVAATMTSPVVSASAGGVAGTLVTSGNSWTITDAMVPKTSGTLTITFSAELKTPLPSSTIVANQATSSVVGFTNPILSDSTDPLDDHGGKDPTLVVITSAPVLKVTKESTPSSNPLLPSGTVLYTMVITNTGNENALSASLQDTMPANTTYVPNSTFLNALPVADVAGRSPLEAGMSVNALLSPAGEMPVGGVATITFSVRINASATNGTIINNQAVLNASGNGSGPISPPILSDDPSTSPSPDPTLDTIGGGSAVYSVKTVTDLNGGTLLPGESLEYEIIISNLGSKNIINVVLGDNIPVNTTYVPGSMLYDSNGTSGGLSYTTLTDSLDADQGNSTGSLVRVVVGTITPGNDVAIKFQVIVDGGVAVGTVIRNQGIVSLDGLPSVATDEDGNSSNGEQPTDIVVGNVPALVGVKNVADINGGAVEPGDDLRYTIVISNVGSVDATNVIVVDALVPPTPTTYVLGSTKVSGVTVADLLGNSALMAGINLGTIVAGSSKSIVFNVNIPLGTPASTVIVNQAQFSADGGLSGITDSNLNDGVESGNNGSDPNDDDPTKIQLGASPSLASVSGTVWMDQNNDGVISASEQKKEGWVVEVVHGGIVLKTTTTDANGNYFVSALPPGTGYDIRFRHPTSGVVYGRPQSNDPDATVNGSTVNGYIQNITLQEGKVTINQNLPLAPSGVVYNSVTRSPVAGVMVFIEGPAGFNPSTHLLPGQNGQITGSDGLYRFDLTDTAPAGTYTIRTVNPGIYMPGKSTIIPAQTTSLTPSLGSPACTIAPSGVCLIVSGNNAPAIGQPTITYLTFNFDPSNPAQPKVVHNHIAIDPILEGAIKVIKTTPMTNITKGSLVPYTIEVQNTLNATLTNIDVVDTMPAGFVYVANSANVAGTVLEPVKVGTKLRWNNLTFTANETKKISLVLVAGIGVNLGIYTNQAFAENNIVGARVSNIATADVRIVADPVFDCPELIGKVFDDHNRNGYQDQNEEGLPGVNVVTARGWIIKTDFDGRYHIACPMIPNDDIGSNFILKLDERTLPTGYRVTNENPRIVRLTRGKMSKINFGASIHRVIRLEFKDEAFAVSSETLKPEWLKNIDVVIKVLREEQSILRISYWATKEENTLANKRMKIIRETIKEKWREKNTSYPLVIEEEISYAKEGGSYGDKK